MPRYFPIFRDGGLVCGKLDCSAFPICDVGNDPYELPARSRSVVMGRNRADIRGGLIIFDGSFGMQSVDCCNWTVMVPGYLRCTDMRCARLDSILTSFVRFKNLQEHLVNNPFGNLCRGYSNGLLFDVLNVHSAGLVYLLWYTA